MAERHGERRILPERGSDFFQCSMNVELNYITFLGGQVI